MYNKLLTISLAFLISGAVHAQNTGVVEQKNPFSQSVQDNKIEIYPNPAVEYLIVSISNSKMEDTKFEMHSIIGNVMTISVQDLGQGKYRIPVENFATGYYFLVVKDEETRFKRAYKFLKD